MAKEPEPSEPNRQPEGLEYENFEELAKKLLKVPKKDLDEARAREEADRQKG